MSNTKPVVIVRFDDAADFDRRVTFWNGSRFVAEYPNATEYTHATVRAAFATASLNGGAVSAIESYGSNDERVLEAA